MDDKELEILMLQDFSYPQQTDKDLQEKLYKKIEFNTYKNPDRPIIKNYNDVKSYRDSICGRPFALLEHQQMLANFINPETPYKGVLIMHGLGTGKTAVAINIAENFKEQVLKYGTKIYVLVPGPNLKESWRNELITSTGNTYLKYVDKNVYHNKQDTQRMNKEALSVALQYYRIMSHKSFQRKVLGEKIVDTTIDSKNNKKHKYRKTEDGEYERELSQDRIHNLNNTLLIVDEAHNLTGNTYGDAVKLIIKNSINLKIVLLTATPMKNLADDIVPLINLLRSENDQIDRNEVFTQEGNHEMNFKDGGKEYLREKVRGYISYLRGADPLIFARRVDHGIIPKSLKFTKVIPCSMSEFQRTVYDDVMKTVDDTLDRRSEAVANFVFPSLNDDRTKVVGCFGKEGILKVRNQLKSNSQLLNSKLYQMMNELRNEKPKNNELIVRSSDGTNFTGDFLNIDNLKYFSIKFYTALKNINKIIYGLHGAHTAFIYSNLVKVGIDIFKQVLIQNGYLEYNENPRILPNTKCYYCGIPYSQHNGDLIIKTKKKTINVPEHTYHPATFMSVTGKSSEEVAEVLPEESQILINTVLNNPNNIDGKYIKFILGSKVINEGINMKNINEVHILDVYFNFGRVDQVVGRAIRRCSHYGQMTENNPYPEVHVYKYAIVHDDNIPSSEEILYQKAESKHVLIKKVERILKEEAIDCALNMTGNVLLDDIEKYKRCDKEGEPKCPSLCDYANCDYKCSNKSLNNKYFDSSNHSYKKLNSNELDKTTFSHNLARTEIEFVKRRIKELFLMNYVYTLESIMNHVKTYYSMKKKDIFDKFYVYEALNELIPTTENDFNNFTDTIIDKYNRQGYLIYVNNFYIYQPFNLHEDVPMYYRQTHDKYIENNVGLYDFLKHSGAFTEFKYESSDEKHDGDNDKKSYDFDSVADYYSGRKEFSIVGIIDKEPNKKKLKTFDELDDVFKIREKRKHDVSKKRGTGIQSMNGTVCHNSQSRTSLNYIMKKVGLISTSKSRIDVCNDIRSKLLDMEKYGTTKNGDKLTYVVIPSNHPTLTFPYNLEDRTEYIIDKINSKIHEDLKINVTNKLEHGKMTYKITFKNSDKLNDYQDFLKSVGAVLVKTEWIINIM